MKIGQQFASEMHFLLEILLKFFKKCKSSVGNAVGNVVGNAAGNSVENLVGNGWGNDAVFSLNTWLRKIYCLQTIHEPACVILTLFQFLKAFHCIHVLLFDLFYNKLFKLHMKTFFLDSFIVRVCKK